MSSKVQLINAESRTAVTFDSVDALLEYIWLLAKAEGARDVEVLTTEGWDRVKYYVKGRRVEWLIVSVGEG